MKYLLIIFIVCWGCSKINPQIVENKSTKAVTVNKNNTWIFVMAGQSNMAGRATIESCDTVTNKRIKVIDVDGNLITAQEPLHRYEPSIMGLDCGISFATELLKRVPDSINIILVPCAIGGTSISEWLSNHTHSGIQLMTNLKDKVGRAKQYGIVKGILWHQGENDATTEHVSYKNDLVSVFDKIKESAGGVPIYAGEIGSFSLLPYFNQINNIINSIGVNIIKTSDLTDNGDKLHFDSKSQREFGKRIANQINIK